ncbi:MAG: DUF5666 domain-containing protein [Minisyncoccia bacterium]
MKNKVGLVIIGSAMAGSLLLSGTALAAAPQTPPQGGHGQWMGHGGAPNQMPPGVFGSVTAINGSTLTVESRGFGKSASTTTDYTVNASGATVTKNGASASLSSIATGDMVMVQGTISGTSVTATAIRDGMSKGGPGMGRGGFGKYASSTPPNIPHGNGEPVIGGTVATIDGTTLTIANKGNITYTVDAANTTVTKQGKSASLSSVSVGDNVLVQGTINGTSVTASSIIDQGAMPQKGTASTTPARGGIEKFFGAIGGFFKHLFGFF